MIRFILLITFIFISPLCARETLTIGSKRFTESYILGEILEQTAQEVGEANIDYQPGLGNTGITFAALENGAIDLYPEYTGTILFELLNLPLHASSDLDTLRTKLQPYGIGADILLGFNNKYALAMRQEDAKRLNIESVSDLRQHPDLKLGFTQEFLKRADGWETLKKEYRLPQENVMGLDHSLGYKAIINGQIEVIAVYTTDPKIEKYNLMILEDDRGFFPQYEAILLYRLDVPKRFPHTWKALQELEGSISYEQMRIMNARAELLGESFEEIARRFLPEKALTFEAEMTKRSFLELLFGSKLWPLAKQHLFLVFGSLIPAIFAGVILGVIAAYNYSTSHVILNVVGVIQTIPSLALFAFLIPILQQIGTLPALIALFLYALLPIVRNTYTGLRNIPKPLRESAIVLGLPKTTRLWLVELPLASRTIVAGIKTAAVINVGMATIAALIGAGGFGERILTGLALNDYEILLSGAIPACALAIFIQLSFDFLDHWLIPKGLR